MAGIALVLAAGLGTRMRSGTAKVLHAICGRPMIAWCVDAAQRAGLEPVVVVHHQEDAVRAALPGVRCVRQPEPHGTGHAVQSAADALPDRGVVVVMPGDAPCVRPGALQALLDAHGDHALTLLTTRLSEPGAYGRIVRDAEGRPTRIVEAAEATIEERTIDEVNAGFYALDAAWLKGALGRLVPHPPKGELYLTDLLEMASGEGRAGAGLVCDPEEVMGVNDRWALCQAARVVGRRILEAHALAGVTFEHADSTVVEAGVEIGPDVVVGAGCVLRGHTRVEAGVVLGPHSVLDDAHVASNARVGPFSRLRPGADIGEGAHVGNFVEVKAARIGAGAKANHLAYIGDADVGAGANVGAGTITCNYDGFAKHRTEIGAGAFIGSNTALVAPVRIGKDAIVGAGSVIVADVPDDAIAVARGTQDVREGAAVRFRARRKREPR